MGQHALKECLALPACPVVINLTTSCSQSLLHSILNKNLQFIQVHKLHFYLLIFTIELLNYFCQPPLSKDLSHIVLNFANNDNCVWISEGEIHLLSSLWVTCSLEVNNQPWLSHTLRSFIRSCSLRALRAACSFVILTQAVKRASRTLLSSLFCFMILLSGC